MKICLVGGIFDRPAALRAKHLLTPETVLLDGFQRGGVAVDAVGHASFQPSDQYDIIHVHHFGKAAVQMAASRGRTRFVFTGHNGLIVTGYESSRLRRAAFQYVAHRADAFVALSAAEGEFFRKSGIGDRIRVIPNGIPADVFRVRDAACNATDRYRLLYVGQLIDWKGVDVLFQAMQKLHRGWKIELRLVYHNAHREPLFRQMVKNLGIEEQVEFVGILGPDELAEEYRRADLLVLPTFADCLPSVVTEALLCGTPVVAGAVCGVPEQVADFGRLVVPGNADMLAESIAAVLSDRPHYRARAAEMHAYAARKFDPVAMVNAHLALYKDLLARQVPSPRGKGWLTPLVRLGIKVYWNRGRVSKQQRGGH